MITKVCFKCNVEKSLDNFYKHPQMLDGTVNKCKDCNKKDVKLNYAEKAKDDSFIEKERIRSKEKYHRLGYKQKQKIWDIDKPWKNNSKYKSLRKKFKSIPSSFHLHHWCYKNEFIEDIIVIERFNHRRAHNFLKLDKENLYFIGLDGEILDTKEKHIMYLINKGIKF
jgi:hypothetical protein